MADLPTIEFVIDPGGDNEILCDVVSFSLREELGKPFQLDIEIRSEGDFGADSAPGLRAKLHIIRSFGIERTIAGIIDAVTVVASSVTGDKSAHVVRIQVRSALGLADRSVGTRIFQDMTVKEIVAQILEDSAGVPSAQQEFRLSESYPKREYCVQYGESILAFVSRLCEEEGIYFFSETAEDLEKIVFADTSPQAAPIDGDSALTFNNSGLAHATECIVEMTDHAALRSGEVVLLDYDFKRPALDMTAKATSDKNTDLSLYDYPGLYVEPSEGKRLARVRLESEQVERQTVDVLADCIRICAGKKLEVAQAKFETVNGEYSIIRAEHHYARHGDYTVAAKLLPLATNFRTRQSTARPIIAGPQTAIVVAPAGAEIESIHTDQHGRAKVKFQWDLAEVDDDKASCWIRVTQLQTSGSMALPRIGWEVVIEFLEGNPDRPIVVGKLYNGQFMPPYALPQGKTRTSLKSHVTPGGGGHNEIRLEDKAGGEEIMINAHKDQNIKTANNRVREIGNNDTHAVKIDQTITVGANQTTKITKGAQGTITGDQSLSIGGDRSVEVNAVTGVTVGGSSSTTVGGNHFEMNGNPLKALIQLAAEKAVEVAQAAAAQAMAQVNAAVQSRVDQAMAPINELTSKAQELGGAMQGIMNGDPSAAAGILAGAAGLPLPPGFGGSGGGEGGGGGGEGGGGEGGEGGEGGGEGGEAAEGGGGGITQALGIDSAVNSAIEHGIQHGADALSSALGLDSEGGGGESAANEVGPEGAVDGVDQADRTKGPGHNKSEVGADYNESVGTLKMTGAINGITTEAGGNMNETVGAAKAILTWGNINYEVGADKNEKALGIVTVSRADESEAVTGSKTQMIGGIIYEKIGGGRSIVAGAPATFIGAFHKIEAATSITLKCGASEVVIDGGGIAITSPIVTITAGKVSVTKAVNHV